MLDADWARLDPRDECAGELQEYLRVLVAGVTQRFDAVVKRSRVLAVEVQARAVCYPRVRLDRLLGIGVEFLEERRGRARSEEHTSELQSLMRSSYDVFCFKKKKAH